MVKFGKGMLFSVEQAFVVKDERRAPLKAPAWEAIRNLEPLLKGCSAAIKKKIARCTFQKRSKKMLSRIRGQILPAGNKSHRKSIKMYA